MGNKRKTIQIELNKDQALYIKTVLLVTDQYYPIAQEILQIIDIAEKEQIYDKK